MYRIDELETIIKCSYPNQVSSATQNMRKTNISAVQSMIQNAIAQNNLQHGVCEERLQIFTTQAGERIFMQYPGKESVLEGAKRRPLDFRPKIMASNGEMVQDLVFADMWRIIEELNGQQHRLLKIMAAIFFRLGRMTFHNAVDKDYICEQLDASGNIIATTNRHLNWFEFGLEHNVMEALNFHADSLKINDDVSISLEAFLCFFELLLQNEDSKYYDIKQNLSSGRIPTSDSMLMLSAYLFGRISLSVLLQRFVSGFGVARCAIDEIESATDNLIKIVDRKRELTDFFEAHSIPYINGSYITVNHIKYRVALKTNMPKIAILSEASEETSAALGQANWSVFDIPTLTGNAEYESLIAHYTQE